MGIYDRDYARPDPPGFSLGGNRMMVTNLILINVIFYLVDVLLFDARMTTRWLALESDLFQQPWKIYQLLTYGFAHDPKNLLHVGFNMFCLWFFGRDVEGVYGRKQFLWIYLTTIIFAGLLWLVSTMGADVRQASLIGASGGTTGIMVLYVFHFPKRTILIWGVFPVPAWVLGGLYIFSDISGAVGRSPGSNVAYVAHLAGAAYGFFYFRTRLSLGNLFSGRFSLGRLKPRPRIRIHDPEERDEAMNEEVDKILRKIKEGGKDSLTAKERRILEKASRRYQQKHR